MKPNHADASTRPLGRLSAGERGPDLLSALLAAIEDAAARGVARGLAEAQARGVGAPEQGDVPTASKRTGVGAKTLRKAYRDGEIAGHCIGRRIMLDADALRTWVEKNATKRAKVVPIRTPAPTPADRLAAAGLVRGAG